MFPLEAAETVDPLMATVQLERVQRAELELTEEQQSLLFSSLQGDEEELAVLQAGLAAPVLVFAFRNIDQDISEAQLQQMKGAGPALVVTKENIKVFAVFPDFGENVTDWMEVEESAVEE